MFVILALVALLHVPDNSHFMDAASPIFSGLRVDDEGPTLDANFADPLPVICRGEQHEPSSFIGIEVAAVVDGHWFCGLAREDDHLAVAGLFPCGSLSEFFVKSLKDVVRLIEPEHFRFNTYFARRGFAVVVHGSVQLDSIAPIGESRQLAMVAWQDRDPWALFASHDVVGFADSIGRLPSFAKSASSLREGAGDKEDSDYRERHRNDCSYHYPNRGVRHALLGCKVAPIWLLLFWGVLAVTSLPLFWWGGLSIVAIEDGDVAKGIFGVLLCTTLCCVLILMGAGVL